MRKKSILAFYAVFFSILLLASVQANIKTNKETYRTGDSVYALSTVGSSDYLCRSQNPPENVILYVVEHKDQWFDGDSFEEIRDETTEVPNSRFSNKKIWENPKAGTYDLIIDCNDDRKYNEASESLYNIGFKITAKKGTGTISEGDRNTDDFSWQYDIEKPDLVNEILQLKLSAKDENIKLGNITIKTNPIATINLEIYIDKNNDGKLNSVDISIGQLNSLQETIILDYTLNQEADENILFVYNMNEEITNGEYSLEIISLEGTGVASDELIKFLGVPVQSSIMTVLDKKTCLGAIDLNLIPNPSPSDRIIIARISNLTGCNNKTVSLRSSECYLPLKKEVGSCVIENDNCEIEISSIKGKYYACIDKNGDNDETDFGESNSRELEIKVKEVPQETEENITAPITGKVTETEDIPENSTQITIDNNLVILVEVTLLLILFVLILIFFKLRSAPSNEFGKSKEIEEPIDIFDELLENKDKDKDKKEVKDKKEEIEDKN